MGLGDGTPTDNPFPGLGDNFPLIQHFMNSAQAKKIALVKFGRRKLQSPAALAQLNRAMNDGKHTDFSTAFAGDGNTRQLVTDINTKLKGFFNAIGLGTLTASMGTNLVFEFTAPDKCSVPKRVWSGHIPFPNGAGLSSSQKTAANQARADYALACGKFRSYYARGWAIFSVLNDVANTEAEPNPGGVVTGHPHTAAGNVALAAERLAHPQPPASH